MRVGLIDGFDHYPGTPATVDGGLGTAWVLQGDQQSLYVTGLSGVGKAIQLLSVPGSATRYFKGGASARITLLFSFKVVAYSGNKVFLQIGDEFGNRQFGFAATNSGKLGLIGENGTLLRQSDVDIALGVVYRLCVQVDSTAGANLITVSVNGLVDASLSTDGLDLIDSPVSTLFGCIAMLTDFGINTIVDDIFIGLDECVELGPKEIITESATATVTAEFTPSTGVSNVANIDEANSNLDVDYNFTSTLNAKDIFEFGDLVRVPDSIVAVAVVSHARKEASATRKFRNILRSGGIEYVGDEFALSESYLWQADYWLKNPNGDVDWTEVSRNAAQAGYKLTSLA